MLKRGEPSLGDDAANNGSNSLRLRSTDVDRSIHVQILRLRQMP
jgi:hypothetical protein